MVRLQNLIVHSNRAVQLASLRAIGNLALNTANQLEMERIVPNILACLNSSPSDDSLLIQAISTLTNIAALENWHPQFSSFIPRYALGLGVLG